MTRHPHARPGVLGVLLLATVLFVWAAIHAAAAVAGTYDVVACDAAGGANNSWQVVDNSPTTVAAYVECPSGGDPGRGMVARNVAVTNGSTGPGSLAQIIFYAPAGTAIVGVQASAAFFKENAGNWEAALSTGSQMLRGCPPSAINCTDTLSNQWVPVPSSSALYIDALCTGTVPCSLDSGDATTGYLTASSHLYSADVRIEDDIAPAMSNQAGSLWTDAWRSGTQTVTFDASDNTGISSNAVTIDGGNRSESDHVCDATLAVPCPQGGATFNVNTAAVADGPHTLTAQTTDAAGNTTTAIQAVRIDNHAPGAPQGLTVDGGEGWRSTNSFTLRWTDPVQDAAPIAATDWQMCPASGAGACKTGSVSGADLTSVPQLSVPSEGDWTIKLWLVDAAGNADEQNAAAPLHLRWDGTAPEAVFEPLDPANPTNIVVQATDATSGLAGGSVEIKPHLGTAWRSIPATIQGGALVATLPDEQLKDGLYDLRALARDQSDNEKTTASFADGSPAQVMLPVRAKTHLVGGKAFHARSHGRRVARYHHTVRVAYRGRVRLRGRLTDAKGHAMAHIPLTVMRRADLPGAMWKTLKTIHTTKSGRFSYLTPSGFSRVFVVRYEGTPTIRPSQAQTKILVAASSTIHADHHTRRDGQRVRFSGTLRGANIPTGGKLVELEVRVNHRWQVFASTRTTSKGRWKRTYKFTGTHGSAVYTFRALVPHEASYPYRAGHSKALHVTVHGP